MIRPAEEFPIFGNGNGHEMEMETVLISILGFVL
jgi:hypothetical protein